MDALQALTQAIRDRRTIRIVYDGGSQPGSQREIRPLRVAGSSLWAFCMASGRAKQFLLSKIRIPSEDGGISAYAAETMTRPTAPRRLTEALGSQRSELEQMGWHVQLDETSATVHRYFKNGKPRKRPDAGILKMDRPGRPWYVHGPGLVVARTFSDITRAVSLFLEQARTYAPARQPDL